MFYILFDFGIYNLASISRHACAQANLCHCKCEEYLAKKAKHQPSLCQIICSSRVFCL